MAPIVALALAAAIAVAGALPARADGPLADWHAYGASASDGDSVTLIIDAVPGLSHIVTAIEASLDDEVILPVELYGLTKVQFDGTSTAVVNLTANTITIANHGLAEDQKVIYHNGGGTSIGGLTSGNVYYVIRTNANTFQLEATLGGGAVDLTGTQASFGTAQRIYPLSRAWNMFNALVLSWPSGLKAVPDTHIILQADPDGDQVSLAISGTTR